MSKEESRKKLISLKSHLQTGLDHVDINRKVVKEISSNPALIIDLEWKEVDHDDSITIAYVDNLFHTRVDGIFFCLENTCDLAVSELNHIFKKYYICIEHYEAEYDNTEFSIGISIPNGGLIASNPNNEDAREGDKDVIGPYSRREDLISAIEDSLVDIKGLSFDDLRI